jgi:uncharacterized OsmC-like protein
MRNRTHSTLIRRQTELCRSYDDRAAEAISVKRVRTEPTPGTDALHGTVVAPGFDGPGWNYGIDAKVGGLDDLPNPGHILCAALASCMESTLRMLAERLGVDLDHVEVEVTGEVDVRGCLAMDAGIRPGFRAIRCDARLEPEAGAEPRLVEVLLVQAERLCVTLDTLRHGVPVSVVTAPRSASQKVNRPASVAEIPGASGERSSAVNR